MWAPLTGSLEEYLEYVEGKNRLIGSIYDAFAQAGADARANPIQWLRSFAAEAQLNGGTFAFDGRGANNVRVLLLLRCSSDGVISHNSPPRKYMCCIYINAYMCVSTCKPRTSSTPA